MKGIFAGLLIIITLLLISGTAGASNIVVNFTANTTTPLINVPVQFTDTSTGPHDTWQWDFGDGGTSSLQNPLYTYTTTGNKTVNLNTELLSDPANATSLTKPNYLYVYPAIPAPPVALFTAAPTNIIIGSTVYFTDTSINGPTSWSWDFGDGTGSISENPSHTYSNVGTYTVTLIASNLGGSNTTIKTNLITVSNAFTPIVMFTSNVSIGSPPLAVKFTDTSLNSPTQWVWNFGDNTYSTIQNPSHTYNQSGIYTVTLTESNGGGSNSTTGTITVVTLVGYNRQDLPMNGYYSYTFFVKDGSTGYPVNSFTVTDSAGNTAQITDGKYVQTFPYGMTSFTVSSSGYQTQKATYLIDDQNENSTMVLYPSPVTNTTQLMYVTPLKVRFLCTNYLNQPISGMNVSITGYQTTLGSNSWVPALFGYNLNNTPLLNATMYGNTGSDGSVNFIMLETEQYMMNFTDQELGINETRYVNPLETEYDYIFYTESQPVSSGVISYGLTDQVINSSMVYLYFNYTDTSQNTDSLKIYVSNGSISNQVYNYTYSHPSTINVTYPLSSQPGITYYWGLSGNSTRYSTPITATNYISAPSSQWLINPLNAKNGDSMAAWIYNGSAILLIGLFSGTLGFNRTNVKIGGITIAIIAGFFTLIGWLEISTLLLSVAIGLGILFYFRFAEEESST
jgi:PKD repeat protein